MNKIGIIIGSAIVATTFLGCSNARKAELTHANDPEMADLVLRVVREGLGGDRIKEIDPVMGGEDFAYYLEKLPGAFLFFGTGTGFPWPHHHPRFDLDEGILPDAAELLARIALDYLKD